MKYAYFKNENLYLKIYKPLSRFKDFKIYFKLFYPELKFDFFFYITHSICKKS